MLAHIHVQRAAGSTLKNIQRSTYGLRHLDVEPWSARFTKKPFTSSDLLRVLRFFPYIKSIQGHRVVPFSDLESACPEIKYISTVREPVSQCASWYQYLKQYRKRSDLTFEKFIQTPFNRNRQTQQFAGSDDADSAIRIIEQKNVFVGLQEKFDETLLIFREIIDPKLRLGYQARNVAKNDSIAQKLLNDYRSRQMIVEATLEDQKLYEYIKFEHYPVYQKGYGGTLRGDLEKFREARGTFNYPNIALAIYQNKILYQPLLFVFRKSIPNTADKGLKA